MHRVGQELRHLLEHGNGISSGPFGYGPNLFPVHIRPRITADRGASRLNVSPTGAAAADGAIAATAGPIGAGGAE